MNEPSEDERAEVEFEHTAGTLDMRAFGYRANAGDLLIALLDDGARRKPPCTHSVRDAAVGSTCPDCGWVLLAVTDI